MHFTTALFLGLIGLVAAAPSPLEARDITADTATYSRTFDIQTPAALTANNKSCSASATCNTNGVCSVTVTCQIK
ncbi:hypothetical protein BJ508DRAFT_418856 [Ascobolus immersus RN42]|uniref:Uncharacterized protein n=1 Tax=Ascobolus immersus RN42 TaxID=1160509 RepID=A0A3N4HQ52_ASCIM|nr:hypothetical protein BJ508DRAFT_418856 [Ascobolus immersus RN42]